ncbi:MAG TPA: hypothetical protein VKZ79_19765 [Alphaproteobacteria bacterium]|nr:hypothetical protein [Alphaproteobacteria bacterium]
MRRFLAIASFLAAAASAAVSIAGPAIFPALEAAAPQRERDFLTIIGNARDDLNGAGTVGKRADVRMGMQVKLANFIQVSDQAKDWVAVVKEHGRTREGDAWITLEIGPNVTVRTVRSLSDDPEHVTLVRAFSPVAERLKKIEIGQKVAFSGTLVRYLITSDEDMIERPQIFAHFTDIKPLGN